MWTPSRVIWKTRPTRVGAQTRRLMVSSCFIERKRGVLEGRGVDVGLKSLEPWWLAAIEDGPGRRERDNAVGN